MKILVAEDDPVSCYLLQTVLLRWGYEVICTQNGLETWQMIELQNSPLVILLDWMLPELDGLEIAGRVRSLKKGQPIHIILLTAYNKREDIVKGLEAGADDYISKPFNIQELRARIRVGERVIQLQTDLANRVKELEHTINQVKKLQGLLPICSYCKKIRDDKNYWRQIEEYISEHTTAVFSHGVCPDCYKKFMDSFTASRNNNNFNWTE